MKKKFPISISNPESLTAETEYSWGARGQETMTTSPPAPPAAATTTEDRGAIMRIPALDGLRGVAILLVVFLHFGVTAQFPVTDHPRLGYWVERCLYIGWCGVDLFFVISGFLISSILLASRRSPFYFKLFYSRRILRIFPLSFGILLIGMLVLPHLPPPLDRLHGQALGHPVWLLTYLSNIALCFGLVGSFGVFDIFWTLAIEEQFYVAWPWLVRQLHPSRLVAVCVGLVALGPLIRGTWVLVGWDPIGAYRFTITRLDGLALGSLIALAYHAGGAHWASATFWARRLAGPAFLGLLALFFAVDRFYPSDRFVLVAGHSLLALFFGCALTLAADGGCAALHPVLTSRSLGLLGQYSYGIYLLHWPLLCVFRDSQLMSRLGLTGSFAGSLIFLTIGVSLSTALGALSYYGYERHFLRLKRFFSYDGATRPASGERDGCTHGGQSARSRLFTSRAP